MYPYIIFDYLSDFRTKGLVFEDVSPRSRFLVPDLGHQPIIC